MRFLHSKVTSVGILLTLAALWVFIAIGSILTLTSCAVEPAKPEVRTETNTVLVPTPVPCLAKSDIPKAPTMTKINPTDATTDQLAAALVLDIYSYSTYSATTEKLLNNCTGDINVK